MINNSNENGHLESNNQINEEMKQVISLNDFLRKINKIRNKVTGIVNNSKTKSQRS